MSYQPPPDQAAAQQAQGPPGAAQQGPPDPTQGVGQPPAAQQQGITANPPTIEINRDALRQALLSKTEDAAGEQDPTSAKERAAAVLELAQALAAIDPSLHPQKPSSAPTGGPQGNANTPGPA